MTGVRFPAGEHFLTKIMVCTNGYDCSFLLRGATNSKIKRYALALTVYRPSFKAWDILPIDIQQVRSLPVVIDYFLCWKAEHKRNRPVLQQLLKTAPDHLQYAIRRLGPVSRTRNLYMCFSLGKLSSVHKRPQMVSDSCMFGLAARIMTKLAGGIDQHSTNARFNASLLY